MCLCVWIFVCQSNRQRMSWVLCCAGISLADTLPGSHHALDQTGNVKQEQHMLIFSCTFILNSVLFNFDLFSLCFLYNLPCGLSLSPPFLSSWLLVCLSCDDDGSCLFPDAQTLFKVPPNNSALMEIFNIACWSPLGAVDGLLVEIGIYERWSAGAEKELGKV